MMLVKYETDKQEKKTKNQTNQEYKDFNGYRTSG